ncbi:hypothetical protein GS16_05440 [Candidatus Liberibacter solanacearum]|uniref:Uncharacterized protein n=1 Tax=Candidatus Liberibacter solanacearum TaxID=556287 RepID=A0A095BEH9_9HYPH|nr:hypothetical protein GS16_05440 [Candidatus Liberibacter solanacearum]KJZ80665.1 hypothetical protein KP07_05795 [Candidatus Liberibacter solanacearum]KJZ81377.1 hypothetical protein DJ66_1273 [Candidatus Liberibacter solanacearum]KQC48697.1 hypothetical protein AP064_05315 [Candidatus Liberibacter solanacearum]
MIVLIFCKKDSKKYLKRAIASYKGIYAINLCNSQNLYLNTKREGQFLFLLLSCDPSQKTSYIINTPLIP